MSLIVGTRKKSRAITRIRIRQRIVTNPEQHHLAQKNSILQGIMGKYQCQDNGQKTSPSRIMASTKDCGFNTQKADSFYSKDSHRNEQFQTINQGKNRETSASKIKKETNTDWPSQRNKFQRNLPTNKQIEMPQIDEQKTNKNRSIHMNYKEYEELIKKSEISPAYFENVARKNDENRVYRDKILQNESKSAKKLDKSKTHYLSQGKQALPTLNKSRRAKTVRSQTQDENSIKTIMGCDLGALSNIQIKQKLEEKWINQQKQNMKRDNTLIFTQESQLVSQIDVKQQTNRDQFWLRDDKKKGKNISKEKEKINWQMIQNQKFKITLQRILELRQNSTAIKDNEQQVSLGQEYLRREQRMFEVNNIYQPKYYIMKHKLQWKR